MFFVAAGPEGNPPTGPAFCSMKVRIPDLGPRRLSASRRFVVGAHARNADRKSPSVVLGRLEPLARRLNSPSLGLGTLAGNVDFQPICLGFERCAGAALAGLFR
jgi:hypothetical protein